MSLESLQNRAFGNASQLFTWGYIRSPEDYLKALDAVTLAEVQAYAQKYLVTENMFTGRV
jgi:predicted Zn-dependent peptidase